MHAPFSLESQCAKPGVLESGEGRADAEVVGVVKLPGELRGQLPPRAMPRRW
ncbi:MAG: hypothetical protein M3520_09760 [Actinomycetota bacterium]|nr:hypothetical protein [Actinomycetota bacterium]